MLRQSLAEAAGKISPQKERKERHSLFLGNINNSCNCSHWLRF